MIRPQKPAQDFVTALETAIGRQVEAFYAPLIGIEPLAFAGSLTDASLLLFTSVNGVEQYAQRCTERNIPALCVGETTAAAAISAGFSATSAGGNVQQLLAKTLAYCADTAAVVLYPCGEQVSFDLVAALQAQNIEAKPAILYRQTEKPFSRVALQLIQSTSVVIPVFSANGAKVLLGALGDTPAKQMTIVAISPTVAAEFALAGFKNIATATTADRAGLIAALRDFV